MWSFLKRFRPPTSLTTSKSHRRRMSGSRLGIESLEGRELFAVLAGESLVNTTTVREQTDVAVASAPDGRSVAVWSHQYSSSDPDIYAQRYNTAGQKVGSEIRVASSTRNERQPDVSMDAAGDFVVTWAVDVSSTDSDILAQRFSSNGSPRGGAITVTAQSKKEYAPSIASASNGDFVVAWTLDYSFTDQDVYARMFRDNGTAMGSAFSVAASSQDELTPDVARSPNGRFAISYKNETSGNHGDVMVKRYGSNGSLVNTHTIASGPRQQWNPRVSMDGNANTIVVWQEQVGNDFDVKARRIGNTGSVGGEMIVSNTTRQEVMPDVAYKRDGSAFVVTYFDATDLSNRVVELDSRGTARHRATISSRPRFEPTAIAFGAGGEYRVAYEKVVGSSGANIYQRVGRLS